MKGSMNTHLGNIVIDPEVIAQYAGSVAVECFGIVHLVGCIHCVDTIYLNILAGRRVDNSVTVINQDTAGFHFAFKLFE